MHTMESFYELFTYKMSIIIISSTRSGFVVGWLLYNNNDSALCLLLLWHCYIVIMIKLSCSHESKASVDFFLNVCVLTLLLLLLFQWWQLMS